MRRMNVGIPSNSLMFAMLLAPIITGKRTPSKPSVSPRLVTVTETVTTESDDGMVRWYKREVTKTKVNLPATEVANWREVLGYLPKP
jgi:hypothetical protein